MRRRPTRTARRPGSASAPSIRLRISSIPLRSHRRPDAAAGRLRGKRQRYEQLQTYSGVKQYTYEQQYAIRRRPDATSSANDSTWYGKTTYTQTTTTETGYEDVYMSEYQGQPADKRQFHRQRYGRRHGNVARQRHRRGHDPGRGGHDEHHLLRRRRSRRAARPAPSAAMTSTLTASSGSAPAPPSTSTPRTRTTRRLGVLNATSTTGDIALIDPSGNMIIRR